MINISFPGGAGGNWLGSTINLESVRHNPVNFHNHIKNKNYQIRIIHELNPNKFHYLFSGKSYFNFYANVLYKFFHYELDIFNTTSYKTHFLECINTARFICAFDKIFDSVFFNFEDLVNSPEKFYNKLCEFQTANNFDKSSYEDFVLRQQKFTSTCVNTLGVYENFDNMIWVCFVLGQLMNSDIVPNDFVIFEKQNQQKCIDFALTQYHNCRLRQVQYFSTNVCLPKLL